MFKNYFITEHAWVRAWSRYGAHAAAVSCSRDALAQQFINALEACEFFVLTRRPRVYKCVKNSVVYTFEARRDAAVLITVFIRTNQRRNRGKRK